jgi:transcriptional regulator with GAF, ATPase, and Fis domain
VRVTGAEQSWVGIFEAADGGTVLLDEVSEVSPRAQAALLRMLDQRVVQPVGSTQPREVDVRILAATNRDLAEGVAEGRFRADLYYPLAVYPLRVPPLRERAEDIPLLVQHFLGRLGDALRRKIRGVDEAAMQALLRYQWPGNLRELDNVIQAAVIRCPRGRCTGDALFSSNGSNRAYSGLLSPKRRPKNPLTSHHPLAS